ncbi:hypothetical protein AB0B25_17355 [Nocardia sp. NPDC049190]|uniref:hypothetical protein n=1 Tax=Nocardia sp. NPDC049190 TaxID=3155650 RepID=UPI0033EDD9C6
MTAPMSTPPSGLLPCAEQPERWDLGTGTAETWMESRQICLRCPLRAPCARRAAHMVEVGWPPREMLWAGVGYDRAGNVIQDLARYSRPKPRRRRRHSVIVGPKFVDVLPSSATDRSTRHSLGTPRTIVFGQR